MRRIAVTAEELAWPAGGESEQQAPEWGFSAEESSGDTTGAGSANAFARCVFNASRFVKEAGAVACKSGTPQFRAAG
jgi:hypothetical protein